MCTNRLRSFSRWNHVNKAIKVNDGLFDWQQDSKRFRSRLKSSELEIDFDECRACSSARTFGTLLPSWSCKRHKALERLKRWFEHERERESLIFISWQRTWNLFHHENSLYRFVTDRLEVLIRIHTIGPGKKGNKTKQQKDRKEQLKIIIGRLDIMVNSSIIPESGGFLATRLSTRSFHGSCDGNKHQEESNGHVKQEQEISFCKIAAADLRVSKTGSTRRGIQTSPFCWSWIRKNGIKRLRKACWN
jgi:hypothetical protein